MLPFSLFLTLSLTHLLMHHCREMRCGVHKEKKKKKKKKHKLHLCCYESSCLVYDWSLIDYSLLLTLCLLALLLPIIIRVYVHFEYENGRERKQQITAIQVLKFTLCMIVARLKRKENCSLMREVRSEDFFTLSTANSTTSYGKLLLTSLNLKSCSWCQQFTLISWS